LSLSLQKDDRRSELQITNALKEHVKIETLRLCRIMGIKKHLIPEITLEILSPTNRKQSNNSMYGVFFEDVDGRLSDLLFVNVASHPNKTALRYTLIHELVHRKHPQMRHGKRFDHIVDDYMHKTKKAKTT
jgi:hypothetical protein